MEHVPVNTKRHNGKRRKGSRGLCLVTVSLSTNADPCRLLEPLTVIGPLVSEFNRFVPN